MADNVTKLEKLKEQIQAAAALDAKKVVEDAEKRAKAMTDEAAAQIEKERGTMLLSRISRYESEERKRVSESRYAADRKVLLHRNALVDELFGDIRAELEAFVKSDKYKPHLEKCIERADREQKITPDVSVFCSRSDIDTVKALVKSRGIEVSADKNIKLGGLIFKYPEKGIFIDLTLDSAFENERGSFASRSEMQL